MEGFRHFITQLEDLGGPECIGPYIKLSHADLSAYDEFVLLFPTGEQVNVFSRSVWNMTDVVKYPIVENKQHKLLVGTLGLGGDD